jgi:hypothetical protein
MINRNLVLVSILVLVILLVSICYFISFNRSIENFSNDASVKFLKKNETCNLIKNIDYFVDFTEADLFARKLISNRNNIFDAYCSGFKNFTKDDKAKLQKVIDSLPKNELLNNFSFAKIGRNIEYGYPHTHKDTIFMSSDTINESLKDLIYVTAHEQMHVMQRKKPELFKKLYLEHLNFKQGSLILDKKYKKLIRSNPDTRLTPENEFLYDNGNGDYYYLNAFFKNNQPDNLGDVDYLGIKCDLTRKDNKNVFTSTDKAIKLKDFSDFSRFFGLTGNHYHPNEISAELIALHYTNRNKEPSPALMKIGRWLRNNIV